MWRQKIMTTEMMKKTGREIAAEIVGSALIALSTYNVALYAEFPMAGLSGICLILYRLFGLPMGVMNLVLNIPVALLCWRLIGTKFILKSLRCMLISSIMLDYGAPLFPVYEGSRMVAAIMTGVIGGIGYGLIYINGSSTGGADFIIMAVKALNPHVKLGNITFGIDMVVIFLSGLIFRDVDSVFYGIMINYILALVVDKMVLGLNSGNVAMIVTEHGREICQLIDQCCMRGSTILKAEGGYQGDEKQVVLVAGSNKDIHMIGKAVKEADPASFTIVLESKEVLGEGFHVTRIAE